LGHRFKIFVLNRFAPFNKGRTCVLFQVFFIQFQNKQLSWNWWSKCEAVTSSFTFLTISWSVASCFVSFY